MTSDLTAAEAPDSQVVHLGKCARRTKRCEEEEGSSGPFKDFEPLQVLGVGSFGKVLLVKARKNQVYLAMKVVLKSQLLKNMADVAHTLTELQILKRTRHPFIVFLASAFQTPKRLVLVMEFCAGGDLFSLMESSVRMPEEPAKFYLAEILLALEYLHSLGIVYRDLKPENVAIDSQGHIKLLDFGLSLDNVCVTEYTCRSRCGTSFYMAPEVHRYLGHGMSSDFWSFGVLAYDLMCGQYPISDFEYEQAVCYPSHLSIEALTLLSKLLVVDKAKRLGAFTVCPDGRVVGGAADVKLQPFFRSLGSFERILAKAVKPPWIPSLLGPDDVSHFSAEFTEAAVDLDMPDQEDLSISSRDQKLFKDYSFRPADADRDEGCD